MPSDLDRARSLLQSSNAIVSFSGAGLSVESGVATYRDLKSGLWAKYDPMTLASPEGFIEDPCLVTNWYAMRRKALASCQPNPAHQALAACPDILHLTQNVDDLLDRACREAGMDSEQIIHLHGRITHDRCSENCGYIHEIDLEQPPEAQTPVDLKICPKCNALQRPDIVWFGEMLPPDDWNRAEHACTTCEILLVIGTSAAVHPAAGLIVTAKQSGATIIIVNTEPSEASYIADIELLGPAGEIVPQLLD